MALVFHNVLNITKREVFRQWLIDHHLTETMCWVEVRRTKIPPEDCLWYLDTVEEALCFGWIDSTTKKVDGRQMQRFSPRRKGGMWSELNKERCRRMEALGLMTDAGRRELPDMTDKGFVIDPYILERFKRHRKAWGNFRKFPTLYQRVRIDTIQRDKTDMAVFDKRLDKLIAAAAENKMIGDWNDYGRLLNY